MKVQKDVFKKGQKEARAYLVMAPPHDIKSKSYDVFIAYYNILISYPNKSPEISLNHTDKNNVVKHISNIGKINRAMLSSSFRIQQ